MRLTPLSAAVALAVSGAAFAAGPGLRLDKLAGLYSRSFMNGTVDGATYRSVNEAEIRPLDATRAKVALSLEFYNGHSCWIEGEAKLEGSRLVMNVPGYDAAEGPPCRLELWTDRTHLRWSDGDATCRAGCGARGTFSSGSLPLRSKRRLPAKPPEPQM